MGRENSGGKGPEGRKKPCMYEKQKEVDLFVFESQGAQGASFSQLAVSWSACLLPLLFAYKFKVHKSNPRQVGYKEGNEQNLLMCCQSENGKVYYTSSGLLNQAKFYQAANCNPVNLHIITLTPSSTMTCLQEISAVSFLETFVNE